MHTEQITEVKSMDRSDVLKYHQLLLPTMRALKMLGGSANIEELNLKIVEVLRLPDEMLDVLQKEGGTQTVIEYRSAWARTYLKNMAC